MNSKMTTNSQLSTTESKKQKQKLSKQLEEGKNHRNGDHMEGYQRVRGGERMGEKVRGRLRIVQEMEKPKNLHVQHMDMNQRGMGGNAGGRGYAWWKGTKGKKETGQL